MSEYGSALDDDEVIFSNEISCNTCARGGLKYIGAQCEITWLRAENLAKLMPSVRYFVKCASNMFYSFKEKYDFFLGTSLLNTNLIRSVI